MTTERRRLCHKGGNKELCRYAPVGSSQHGRETPVLISLINGGQVMLKDKVSLYGRCEMKWAKNDGRLFSITRPFYNFKRLFFACCLFQFPPPVYKLHRGRFCRHHRCLLLFFSISISCEWNTCGSTSIPHSSRSHNLIHLCDKLHYEGSQ